jgi:Protein of unknown function (DUF3095)
MFDPVKSDDFYSRLPSFSNFQELTLDRHFVRAPDEWFVVMTDVVGSTQAIEAGRYKDVNIIGAASISVVSGLLGRDLPSMFGGDGATLLVPPEVIDRVLDGLGRLQCLSRKRFQIELRVGRISVGELHRAGHAIEVAKHELRAGKCTAIFRGGGMSEAEKRIKWQSSTYCVEAATDGELELTGLSCRWNPLKNRRGRIMSLLVRSQVEPAAKVYDELLAELNRIYDGQFDEMNPVSNESLSYRSVADCIQGESRFHTRKGTISYLKRLIEIVASVLIFKYRLRPLVFDAGCYQASMREHSDHRKFDDMLRMILDCSDAQVEAIRAYLDEQRLKGKLCYGIHLSDAALMTCFVQDIQDGHHIHFIDGGDGGYTMASKQLKEQLSKTIDWRFGERHGDGPAPL